MSIKTITSTHKALKESLKFLEEKKTEADNARKVAKMRRELDILEARIKQAEKKVVEDAKDFVQSLKEAQISF